MERFKVVAENPHVICVTLSGRMEVSLEDVIGVIDSVPGVVATDCHPGEQDDCLVWVDLSESAEAVQVQYDIETRLHDMRTPCKVS